MTSRNEGEAWSADVSLQGLNTLALPAVAKRYYPISNTAQLQEALEYFREQSIQPLLLGAGSNVVLARSEYAHCLRMETRGINIVTEDTDFVTLEVAAGENWDELVNHCLRHGYFGLENLALIPGTVGAAPIQNIGAYGVELDQFVEQVRCVDRQKGGEQLFDNSECEFSYRHSVFKGRLKDQCLITHVTLKLRKTPAVNITYQSLAEELSYVKEPSPEQVRDAVVKIRQSKLPDPAQKPNVGSFFKNPLVDASQLKLLLKDYAEIVSYPTSDPACYKLAAGWLLERAGWKGYRHNNVAMHAEQALVLTNLGGATGDDVMRMAAEIVADIERKFAVRLEVEPRIYD